MDASGALASAPSSAAPSGSRSPMFPPGADREEWGPRFNCAPSTSAAASQAMPASGRKRKANFSNDETETLVWNVVRHFSALYGSEALRAHPVRRKQLWTQIQSRVNFLGYTERSIDDLKHKWRDLRLDVKKKITSKKHLPMNRAGGPLHKPRLTPLEKMVASTFLQASHDSEPEIILDPDLFFPGASKQPFMHLQPGVSHPSIYIDTNGQPSALPDVEGSAGAAPAGTEPRPRRRLRVPSRRAGRLRRVGTGAAHSRRVGHLPVPAKRVPGLLRLHVGGGGTGRPGGGEGPRWGRGDAAGARGPHVSGGGHETVPPGHADPPVQLPGLRHFPARGLPQPRGRSLGLGARGRVRPARPGPRARLGASRGAGGRPGPGDGRLAQGTDGAHLGEGSGGGGAPGPLPAARRPDRGVAALLRLPARRRPGRRRPRPRAGLLPPARGPPRELED
uniref:Uncharacterized protein n=1 Tax=Geospiza parvula TaxID=87175 RepID=A0A8U8BW64_GEOPR